MTNFSIYSCVASWLFLQVLPKPPKDKPVKPPVASVKCDTCDITLNSDAQAQQHYTGRSHLKKLKSLGLPVTPEQMKKLAKPYSEYALLFFCGFACCPFCHVFRWSHFRMQQYRDKPLYKNHLSSSQVVQQDR